MRDLDFEKKKKNSNLSEQLEIIKDREMTDMCVVISILKKENINLYQTGSIM